MKYFCDLCERKPQKGFNKPHSQHRTKRTILPNVQKFGKKWLCVRCKRTVLKKEFALA